MDFDEWYDLLRQELVDKGFDPTAIEKVTASSDYEIGFSPTTSAELFIKQWNNDPTT